VICDERRREEAGELEPAVAVRCAHHGNLETLIAQPVDTSDPFSFNRGSPIEFEAEFAKRNQSPLRGLRQYALFSGYALFSAHVFKRDRRGIALLRH
jgi:hypothetical protein